MSKLPAGKTRLDLVREQAFDLSLRKRGRMVLSLDRLLEDPANERKTFRNMSGLIASVKANGIIEPIIVSEVPGSDVYRILAGHRRYRAAREAGLTQVEVLIREPEAESQRRLKSIVSNLQREDVGPVEMAEALQSLLDDGQFTKRQDLAGAIGKSPAWVSDILAVLSLPVGLQERVRSSESVASYDAVIKIARMGDAKKQAELVDALLSGASSRDIRDQIDQHKGKPKKAKSGTEEEHPSKPKKVFGTKFKAIVIIQSETTTLSENTVIDALQEALGRAVNGTG